MGVYGNIMETSEVVMVMGDDAMVTCEVGILLDDGVGDGDVSSVNTQR